MTSAGVNHSLQNLTLLRIAGNSLVNLLLMPIYAAGLLLCFVLALTPIFPARTARENFKNRMQLNAPARVLATTATLFHYVLILIEDFILWPLGLIVLRENSTSCQEVTTASLRAKSNSIGLTVLSAHFGNIEITAQFLNLLLQGQVTEKQLIIALAKPSRAQFITRLLGWYRGLRGIEVLWTNRKDLVKAMLSALKNGRAIALLIDQKPASQGFFVDFYGAQSAFPEGGVDIAMRSNCEFVCAASRRIWPGIYTFEGCSLQFSEDSQRRTETVVRLYARWLESVIELSPWQWCWDYRKWSRQPRSELTI